MACSSCGRDTELRAGADGALYCGDCIISAQPACHECEKCFQRVCGVYACPFCLAAPSPDVSLFNKRLRAQPIRIEEKCGRCGGEMERAFILRGKALCKSCLLYEQDRWEIVPGKPGKGGARVKIVLHKSAIAQDKDREAAVPLYRNPPCQAASRPIEGRQDAGRCLQVLRRREEWEKAQEAGRVFPG
jgi:hypothetical protein